MAVRDLSVHLASYEKKMEKLRRLVGGMLDSVINTVIVCGPSGIGKTYTINNILQARSESDTAPIRFKTITGKITARSFFDHLVENSTFDCVTFFDDADFIFHDPVCIGLLREASEKYGQRIINYRTAKNKGDDCVTFDGKIIVSTNLRIGSSPHLNAVKDRFHILNVEVTFLEKLGKIQEIATLNTHGYLGQKISVDANREILTFLFEHQHRIGEDKLSLRMFCKAQELYVAMPDSWRDYVEDMLLTPRLKGP